MMVLWVQVVRRGKVRIWQMTKSITIVAIILLALSLFGCNQSTAIPSMEIVYITVGDGVSYAIDSDGNLWAWGNNTSGQIGDGTITIWDETGGTGRPAELIEYNNRHTPIKIMDSVVSISSGRAHTMAIRTDGSLWGWGDNAFGALGDGTTESRLTPTRIMESVSAVSVGFGHTLAIKDDGSLWAWGQNHSGQLGDGTHTTHQVNDNNRHRPIKIMDSVTYISAGFFHSMAITADGTLWAWGNHSHYQLGNGWRGNEISFNGQNIQTVPIPIMDSVVSVSAGSDHTMAIGADGSLWAWGSNWVGQLGGEAIDGHFYNRTTPMKIMDSVMSVSAGQSHTMAIMADGSLWGWGGDRGAIGSDDGVVYRYHGGWRRRAQIPVTIMDSVVMVSAGRSHTLALTIDGSVWAWGSNWSGQLGDGTTVQRNFPVKIIDGSSDQFDTQP